MLEHYSKLLVMFHPFIFIFVVLTQLAYPFYYLLINSLLVHIYNVFFINYNWHKYCIAVIIYY